MEIIILIFFSLFFARSASFCYADSKIKKNVKIHNNVLARILIPQHYYQGIFKTENEKPYNISIFGLVSYITTGLLILVWFIGAFIEKNIYIEEIHMLSAANLIITFLLNGFNLPKSHYLKSLFLLTFFIVLSCLFIIIWIQIGFGT